MILNKIGSGLEQVHAWQRGLRHQRRVRGHRRRFHLHTVVSAQLQLALMKAVQLRHRSKSMIVEEALWRELGRLSAQNKAGLIQRLKYLDALVSEIIGSVGVMNASETLPRDSEQRLNEVAEKTRESMNQTFDLVQTEPLAGADQRAVMYRVLARLANMTAKLLDGAAGQDILYEMNKLREDQLAFQELAKQFEDEAKESTAGKREVFSPDKTN